MRKFVKLISAFALVALCAVLFCFASLPVVGIAEEQTQAESTDTIKAFVKQLCEYNGAGDKAGARNYIVEAFQNAVGEDGETPASESQVKSLPFGKNGNSYVNIEVKLDVGSTKQIIIGAHYDTVGEGAGDNVCGVAALYQTLNALYQHKENLPFNVVIVAFDGEEDGLVGSSYYVNEYMSEEEIANTLVMFNVDSIAPNGQLYLMCENKSTDLAKLILKGRDPHLIREKPYARGTYNELDRSFGYGYYEMVQGSDHTPFRLQGVPIAFFFSGTYALGSWNFIADSAINTSSDTYENLTKFSFAERILTVSDAIVDAVLSEEFVDVAENARNQLVNLNLWYNAWWSTIVVGVILIALVVATILYNRKLQKKAILGTAEIKNNKVFDKPAAEDIFTFKDEKDAQNGNDMDDIFTFKK